MRVCALAVALGAPVPAPAHDPDTTGGLYRSLDAGANWSPINPGIFPSGALALAANPRDAQQLLLATDSGLWRSNNAGRDWQLDTHELLRGPVFGAAFAPDGRRTLAATGSGLLRNDGDGWRPQKAPTAATPVRALVSDGARDRVFLVGRSGLYRSDDFGRSWKTIGEAFGAREVSAVVTTPAQPDTAYAIVAGALWTSTDAGLRWQRLGGPVEPVDALAVDARHAARLWSVSAARVHRSDDGGGTWRAMGQFLPDAAAKARALVVSGQTLIVATDRGLFRSADGAATWDPPKENLPAHLAAGVLVRDGADAATLYAGFALASYDDLRASAPQPAASLGAAWGDPVNLAAAAAALVVLGGIVFALRARARSRKADHAVHAVAGSR